MIRFDRALTSAGRLRRFLLPVGLLLLAVWLLFFDSHNLVRRVQWHRELASYRAQNEALQHEIDVLELKLEDVESEEVVEQIAREQYGMRRPGERIYRVEKRE